MVGKRRHELWDLRDKRELEEKKMVSVQQKSKSRDPGGRGGHVLGVAQEQEPLRLMSDTGWRRQG